MPTCSRSARERAALTWRLTGNQATATRDSPRCQGSITIVKVLHPSNDRRQVHTSRSTARPAGGAAAVGDGGTTGTIAVEPRRAHRRRVGRATAPSSRRLRHADRLPERRRASSPRAAAPRLSVPVKLRQAVLCTITNTLKAAEADVVPMLECVVFRHGAPRRRGLGLLEPGTTFRSRSRSGAANGFAPAPPPAASRSVFEPGRLDRRVPDAVRQRRARSPGRSASKTVTASSTSGRCTATLELRKVTAPADDPGVFNLLLNGQRSHERPQRDDHRSAHGRGRRGHGQ